MTPLYKLLSVFMLCSSTLAQASFLGCVNWVCDTEDAVLSMYGGKYTSAEFRSARLVDIDNDGDLDLFVLARLLPFTYGSGETYPMVYQFENKGDLKTPDYHLLNRSVAYDFEVQAGLNVAQWEQLAFVDWC